MPCHLDQNYHFIANEYYTRQLNFNLPWWQVVMKVKLHHSNDTMIISFIHVVLLVFLNFTVFVLLNRPVKNEITVALRTIFRFIPSRAGASWNINFNFVQVLFILYQQFRTTTL